MSDLKTLDIQRAINHLCQMYLPWFDEEEWCAIHTAIVALEEKKEREMKAKNK